MRKEIGENSTQLNVRAHVLSGDAKVESFRNCTPSLLFGLSAHSWALLPDNLALLQRPASERCIPSSHLTQADGGEQMPDFAFKYKPHTQTTPWQPERFPW